MTNYLKPTLFQQTLIFVGLLIEYVATALLLGYNLLKSLLNYLWNSPVGVGLLCFTSVCTVLYFLDLHPVFYLTK